MLLWVNWGGGSSKATLSDLAGDFNVEPTKIHCLAEGISAGFWVDLESSWSFASGMPPAITCRRSWGATGGNRRDLVVGCPLVAAAVNSCSVKLDRWLVPHHAVRASFLYSRWTCQVSQPVRCTPPLACFLVAGFG